MTDKILPFASGKALDPEQGGTGLNADEHGTLGQLLGTSGADSGLQLFTLTEGTGITIDYTTPGQIIISSSGSAGALLAVNNLDDVADPTTALENLAGCPKGPLADCGITSNQDILVGRSTAGVGFLEEITVGPGLQLVAGELSSSGGTTNSGTYTPAIVGGDNLDNIVPTAFQWMQVGTTVSLSGAFDLDPTAAATDTGFFFSLPVPSAFGANYHGAGVGATGDTNDNPARISANAGTAYLRLQFVSLTTVNHRWFVTATYQVV